MVRNQITVHGVRANSNGNLTMSSMIADDSLDSKSFVAHAYRIEDTKSGLYLY